MPDLPKQVLGYTADTYTPAYLSYAHNVGRMATPLLVYDLARLDPKAVHLRLHPSIGAEPMYAVETAEEVLLEWNAIMLVTATEAYLQDALAFHASHDPNLMRASEQAAQYAEVVSAASLTDLADLLRSRWARNFLEKGGPAKWRERLEKLGVRGFPKEMDDLLETLWGVRHMLIHHAGIATTDFIQRHPSFGVKVGERIRLQRSHLRTWLDPIDGFVSTYERFLYHRFLKTKAVDDQVLGDNQEHPVARAVRLLGVNRERLARLVMLSVPDLEQFLMAPEQMPAVVRMRLGLALWHTASWDASGPETIPVDAVAGLFVAILRTPECATAVAHEGWVLSPGRLGMQAEDLLSDDSPVRGIVAESALLSHPVKLEWKPGPPRDILTSVRGGSDRFRSWCAHNGLSHWER